jgi:hypothetical protein
MKYIFKQIDNISGRNAETTIEFSTDTLPDVLEHFEMFIRGCGFYPTGTLEFVDYEDPYTTPKFECAEENYEDENEETHEWTQTLRGDSEWPFQKQKTVEVSVPESIYDGDLNSPSAGASDSWTNPWQGVAPSTAMQWTVDQLMKEKPVCPVCKIDNETMAQHECWDDNCPKGKDAN